MGHELHCDNKNRCSRAEDVRKCHIIYIYIKAYYREPVEKIPFTPFSNIEKNP